MRHAGRAAGVSPRLPSIRILVESHPRPGIITVTIEGKKGIPAMRSRAIILLMGLALVLTMAWAGGCKKESPAKGGPAKFERVRKLEPKVEPLPASGEPGSLASTPAPAAAGTGGAATPAPAAATTGGAATPPASTPPATPAPAGGTETPAPAATAPAPAPANPS